MDRDKMKYLHRHLNRETASPEADTDGKKQEAGKNGRRQENREAPDA